MKASLRDAIQQIVLSTVEILRAHDSFWRSTTGLRELRTWGDDPRETPSRPGWDHAALAEQARHDVIEIQDLLQGVLEPWVLERVLDDISGSVFHADDELWARVVYAFVAAARRGATSVEHLAAMFVPLYLWRAAAFMADTANADVESVQRRLDSVCDTFQRLKPVLVSSWTTEE